MVDDIYPILKQYFGFDEFRFPQKEIITDVLSKKDVFVLIGVNILEENFLVRSYRFNWYSNR